MNSIPITKDDSALVKGTALIIMLFHHLFAFDWSAPLFTTWIPGMDDVVVILANYFQIVVGVFLFLSGFGLFYSRKGVSACIKRIASLYVRLWIVIFFVSFPLMLLAGTFSFNLPELLKNMVGLGVTYCQNCWFVTLYAEILVLLTLIWPLLERTNWVADILITVCCVLAGVVLSFWNRSSVSNRILSICLSQLRQLLLYFPNFLIGLYSAKYSLLGIAVRAFQPKGKIFSLLSGIFLFAGSVLIYWLAHPYIPLLCQDYYLVPLFVLAMLLIFKLPGVKPVSRVLQWLGTTSLWFWLIHGILQANFTDLIYFPRYPVLILLWLTLLQVPVVVLIQLVEKFIQKKILKKNRKEA